MTEWSARSKIPAALLNPAVLAAVVAAGAGGYERETRVLMPWPLSFVIAPLALHRGTREALPTTLATHLGAWVSRNPVLRAGVPLRARALVEPVREGVRFGLRYGLLTAEDGGTLRQGVPAPQPPDTGDLRDVLRKATFAGRWVSRMEQPGTVFALFGITV
jgi:Family of unknown function (DUF6521)